MAIVKDSPFIGRWTAESKNLEKRQNSPFRPHCRGVSSVITKARSVLAERVECVFLLEASAVAVAWKIKIPERLRVLRGMAEV